MKKILFMSEEEARTTLYCTGLEGNYEIFVVGNINKNQTIQYHPMCKEFINLKTSLTTENTTKDLCDEILNIIKEKSIDILFPISNKCLAFTDTFKSELEKHVLITPFPTKESIDELDNKYNFYLFCQKHNIAHPNSVLAKTCADLTKENITIEFPVLVKPILGAGGINTLVLLNNWQEMNDFINKPKKETKKYFPALIQECFEGEDIDFNGFSINGKVLASSVMTTEFYGKNNELFFTDFVDNKQVIELGEKILKESAYSGPTNIDMRIRKSDGKLMLIEVNPRYWARVQVSLMDNMNFLDIAIRATLGEEIRAYSTCPRTRWVSSFSPLLKLIFKERKIFLIKNIFLISKIQLSFLIFNKRFLKRANKLISSK